MIKNLKKFIKKNTALSVVVLLALVIGLPTLAINSFDERVIDRIADKYLEKVEAVTDGLGEMALGAITQDKSRYQHGIDLVTGGLTMTGGDLNISGLSSGGVDLSNVTTTIPWLDASFQVALDFQRATTTYGGATETELVVGTVQNTGSDLLCTDVWVDISTANGIFAYDIRVGTSTTATSSNAAHLINATTDGHEITTTTVDILSKEDDEGTSNTEVWDFNTGEFLAVTQIYNAVNATSGDSFTVAGGNATAGKLHVNCRSRY